MKWIGQHIYDKISRFRSDVYLESISTGTIASGAHLGLDSSNKIVKAVDGGGDVTLAGTQTFTGNKTFNETIIGSINGSAATVATIAGLAPNTATTQATQPAIESIGTDGDTLVILADELHMSNTTADAPIIKLINTTNDDQASQLIFEKLRADDAVAVGQNIGEIWFRGQDAAQNTQNYGFVLGEIDVSTSGQESGKVSLGIANHDGGNGRGLILTGGSENNEVDAIIGLGANSVTTVAGDLVVTSDLTVSGDTVTFESANADDPIVTIKNTSNAANDMASLNFVKIRDNSGTAATGDNLAEIYFTGEDASGNTQEYARVLSEIDVATHGQESGRLKFGVASHDGGNGYGLTMQGGSEDNEVDVTLGLGANSVVTVPGNIDLAGDIDVDGTLETDALTIGGATIAAIGTTAITTLGTIGTGVWQGTTIKTAYIGDDQVTEDKLANTLLAEIDANTAKVTNSDQSKADINALDITELGTISSGVWNGTAIASANLDADTMHYSAQRQLTHHTIVDDIDTQVVFLSLAEFDGENTTISNNKLPLIAPVAGKLLKVFVRCSHNLSGVDFTWKLYTRTSSASTNGNAAEIGAQTGTGPTNGNMVTYDFTTGLDSGTNAIGAGDKVQISLETDGSTSNANFFITLMWEWNLS